MIPSRDGHVNSPGGAVPLASTSGTRASRADEGVRPTTEMQSTKGLL
jgi:hypothetical protein